ncbi:CD209 antigen-like protein E [Danio aesculapii]|uniref:CD209 antigen-like protein E n=1 Tax=Danio aesculapii TaxID=1142201 RepID=UPI0024C0D9C3|nr:CD209 antigen-like protein E [Danio aesculapii]
MDRCSLRNETGSDSVKKRNSRAALVCLVLLCFLLLTAVIMLSVFNYTNNTNYTEERRQLITNIANITEDKDKLLTIITNITEDKDKLITNIINLTEDRDELVNKITWFTKVRDELKIENTNLLKERDQLIKQLQFFGQEAYYQSSLYYLSSEKKSWTESRRDCKDRGADLIIINNQREQDFIMNITSNNEFWIGVTDSDEEGIWKWVDGSNLTSRFWASYGSITEPNGQTKENCVVTHLKKHPYLIGWLDVTCAGAHQWICEKNILPVTV